MPSVNKRFKEKYDFPFDLLSDQDKAVSISFGVTESAAGNAGRMSVLINPGGQIAKIYDKVKPADHPDQVLTDLGLT